MNILSRLFGDSSKDIKSEQNKADTGVPATDSRKDSSLLQPQVNLNNEAVRSAVEKMRSFEEHRGLNTLPQASSRPADSNPQSDGPSKFQQQALNKAEQSLRKMDGSTGERQDAMAVSRALERLNQMQQSSQARTTSTAPAAADPAAAASPAAPSAPAAGASQAPAAAAARPATSGTVSESAGTVVTDRPATAASSAAAGTATQSNAVAAAAARPASTTAPAGPAAAGISAAAARPATSTSSASAGTATQSNAGAVASARPASTTAPAGPAAAGTSSAAARPATSTSSAAAGAATQSNAGAAAAARPASTTAPAGPAAAGTSSAAARPATSTSSAAAGTTSQSTTAAGAAAAAQSNTGTAAQPAAAAKTSTRLHLRHNHDGSRTASMASLIAAQKASDTQQVNSNAAEAAAASTASYASAGASAADSNDDAAKPSARHQVSSKPAQPAAQSDRSSQAVTSNASAASGSAVAGASVAAAAAAPAKAAVSSSQAGASVRTGKKHDKGSGSQGDDDGSLKGLKLGDFSPVYVKEDDDLEAMRRQLSAGQLIVPADLTQAHMLFGHDAHSIKNALNPYKRYIDLCEDRFLGERFSAAPARTGNLYVIEDRYMSNGFHFSEMPEHTLIEFFQVLASRNPADPLSRCGEDEFGRVWAVKLKRLMLRRILFNNPVLNTVNAAGDLSQGQEWEVWREGFNRHNNNTHDNKAASFEITDEILEQLKKEFGSFANFQKAVDLLRYSSTDYETNRQWCTRFVFTYGLNTIFNEVVIYGSLQNNIMGGQGHLVYAMLQRGCSLITAQDPDSKLADTGRVLFERFFNEDPVDELAARINRCAVVNTEERKGSADENIFLFNLQKFAAECQDGNVTLARARAEAINENYCGESVFCRPVSYLPYKDLKLFGNLLEDVNSLLSLQLSKQDLFLALSQICTLYLLVFLTEQQQKMCNCLRDYEDTLKSESGRGASTQRQVMDINMVICPEDADLPAIKRLSIDRVRENNNLLSQSQKAYVRHRMNRAVDLAAPFLRRKSALKSDEQKFLKHLLLAVFDFDYKAVDDEDNEKARKDKQNALRKIDRSLDNCDKLIDTMCDVVINRDVHMHGIHLRMLQAIGLGIGKSNPGLTQYSMSDSLTKTLVMTVLGDREYMKLSDFMNILYERWHIVIGPRESYQYHDSNRMENNINKKDFELNEALFKKTLHRLNMLIRLSDLCDYIKKPW